MNLKTDESVKRIYLPEVVGRVGVDAVQRAAQAVRRDAAQLGDEQTPAS